MSQSCFAFARSPVRTSAASTAVSLLSTFSPASAYAWYFFAYGIVSL